GRRRNGLHRFGEHRRQEAGVESELLIERVVPRALCEREETAVSGLPPLEGLDRRLEQSASDAAVPEIRSNRQRSEEAHASPVRREVRADELPVELGGERRAGFGAPARAHVVRVTAEAQGVAQAEERPEGQSKDTICSIELRFAKRTDHEAHAVLASDAAEGLCAERMRRVLAWARYAGPETRRRSCT